MLKTTAELMSGRSLLNYVDLTAELFLFHCFNTKSLPKTALAVAQPGYTPDLLVIRCCAEQDRHA